MTADMLASRMMHAIEDWVESREERHLKLFLSAKDRVRILRLRTWTLRYRVTAGELLDIVMPVLRRIQKGGRRKPGPHSLGIRITSLTGKFAEQVLREGVLSAGVDWRERERDRQLAAEEAEAADGMRVREQGMTSVLEAGSVRQYTADYTARVMARREKLRREAAAAWRRRRAYRGNPWR
jgi:hypothetical protein